MPPPTATHMTPTNVDLGVAIRLVRRARDLTIDDLAFAADMHPTYLSGIERGIRNPTWDKLATLARALDIPVSALIRDGKLTSPKDDDGRLVVMSPAFREHI
jgi:transcriptional regulator with XRE-family HTH domain